MSKQLPTSNPASLSPENNPPYDINDVSISPTASEQYVVTDVGLAIARHQSTTDARSLATIDRLPTDVKTPGPLGVYHPFSPAVVALLMPASVFGVLARLGLDALATYDGKSIFPLAYAQALGCFIMGMALSLKDTISG